MKLLANLAVPLAIILSNCLLPSVLAVPTPAPQAIAFNVEDDKFRETPTMAESSSSSLRTRQCLPGISSGEKMQPGGVGNNLDSLAVAHHGSRDESELDCAAMVESRQAIHGAEEVKGHMHNAFSVEEEEEEKEKKKKTIR